MTSTAGPTHLSCVLQWNCRGLTGKLGELKYRMRIGQLSAWALLLQETNCAPQISEFSVHTSPSIRDRRGVRPDIPPGKAIVYVRSHLPQAQVPLPAWCTAWQEVVAVRVRLSHSEVILVSYYARPSSGHASRIRLGWLSHLRHNFPGVPILVCGDFNAPHGSWGYPRNSSRGQLVEDTFRGANFQLLNDVLSPTRRQTHPRTPSYSPDLTWWLGHGAPSWHLELDCWASDHHPIYIRLAAGPVPRLRRRCRVIDWDEFRSQLSPLEQETDDPISILQSALHASTHISWVDEARPTPDLHLLRLWAARRRAELTAARQPSSESAKIHLNHLTAQARRHERRLSRARWMDWCASLGPSTNTASISRMFLAME